MWYRLAKHSGVMVAFYLPKSVAKKLVLSPKDCPEDTDPESLSDLHLTLGYLGSAQDYSDQDKKNLLKALEVFVQDVDPIIGEVSGIGRFYNAEGDQSQAFYASVDAPQLSAFRQNLVDFIDSKTPCTVSQTHGYTPHITLAYVPKESPSPDVIFSPIPVKFNQLVVAWADQHHPIAFPKRS